MPEEYTQKEINMIVGNITEKYKNLTTVIGDGFKGVHARQDKTNGNVEKNTAFRNKSEGSIVTLKFILGFLGAGIIANMFISYFK